MSTFGVQRARRQKGVRAQTTTRGNTARQVHRPYNDDGHKYPFHPPVNMDTAQSVISVDGTSVVAHGGASAVTVTRGGAGAAATDRGYATSAGMSSITGGGISIVARNGAVVAAHGSSVSITPNGRTGSAAMPTDARASTRQSGGKRSTITNGNVSIVSSGGAVSMTRDGGHGGAPVVDTISTTGDETWITYDGPPAAFVTVRNTGGQCRLIQTVNGEHVTTHIGPNTTTTVSPMGESTLVPLVVPRRFLQRLIVPVGAAVVSLSLAYVLFSQ